MHWHHIVLLKWHDLDCFVVVTTIDGEDWIDSTLSSLVLMHSLLPLIQANLSSRYGHCWRSGKESSQLLQFHSYHQIDTKFGWNGLGIKQKSIARGFVSLEQTKLVSGLHKRQRGKIFRAVAQHHIHQSMAANILIWQLLNNSLHQGQKLWHLSPNMVHFGGVKGVDISWRYSTY